MIGRRLYKWCQMDWECVDCLNVVKIDQLRRLYIYIYIYIYIIFFFEMAATHMRSITSSVSKFIKTKLSFLANKSRLLFS